MMAEAVPCPAIWMYYELCSLDLCTLNAPLVLKGILVDGDDGSLKHAF